MDNSFASRCQALLSDERHPDYARGLKGLERESLRVTPSGHIAQTPHPRSLGSALTHPAITTDYSEALLEFVTNPHATPEATLAELQAIECFAARRIHPELLWPNSMPCLLESAEEIPIARYGASNIGQMKHIYRKGLALRYGKAMQIISGIHYNYSVPPHFWSKWRQTTPTPLSDRELRDSAYMGLVRNVQRYGWLLLYLFGSSPALCPSFLPEKPAWLKAMSNGTLYAPYATSLRMSDIGYKNKNQAGLRICTNSLSSYIADLSRALETEDPTYAALGVRVDDNWRQLSAGMLQIENEYYGLVRPKNRPRRAERPTLALQRDGIQYVEIRALDSNPFMPLGLGLSELYFLEVFALFCLLEPSPPLTPEDELYISHNQRNTAVRGREPGLCLYRQGCRVPVHVWLMELTEKLEQTAELLDLDTQTGTYARAVAEQVDKITGREPLPSERVLREVQAHPEGFLAWSLEYANRHTQTLLQFPMSDATAAKLTEMATSSLTQQQDLENSDDLSFEQFLAKYYQGEPGPY